VFVKELRELFEVLVRIAVALEQLADDSLAARNRAEPRDPLLPLRPSSPTMIQEAPNGHRR
jgi:hypothetical protein